MNFAHVHLNQTDRVTKRQVYEIKNKVLTRPFAKPGVIVII